MTAPAFELELATDPDDGVARLRLKDAAGVQRAAHQVKLAEHSPAMWEGLFDTRAYVERYQGGTRFTDRPATAAELLARLGVFLGREVLGDEITAALAKGIQRRSLVVRLPATAEDPLAAAFARVPWEIARPAAGEKPLMARNLTVRTVMEEIADVPLPAEDDGEPVRVLLVFAEAPGSRPLAMRRERELLLELFHDRVMPKRRVAVDVLCHGVSREALAEAVTEHGGYHVIHWSGHGHRDLLELHGGGGEPNLLTGEGLVELIDRAGGFVPRLMFLSACQSGAMMHVRDRAALERALEQAARRALGDEPARDSSADADEPAPRDPAAKDTAARDTATPREEPEEAEEAVERQSGYTGTALALRRAGVPQVIAMRYEVGDPYARDLAALFYQRLFADAAPKAADEALALARRKLYDQPAPGHGVLDHATPMILGPAGLALEPPKGRSPALGRRRPQPQPLLPGSRELDRPTSFVGRGAELTELNARWLGAGAPAVALVQGLAGLGKTALAAEAIHLWHDRFDGVFAFQAKPTALTLDELLRGLDQRLALHSETYRQLGDERPNARVFLKTSGELKGPERYRLLRDNLLEVLTEERLLLVLDNFETQLETVGGEAGYACADPEWDALLAALAERLPETGSRLVVTSRHRPAALAGDGVLWIPLGPLPMREATLYLQESDALRALAFGDDPDARRLAMRLLEVSRGHPLILDRLGALAGEPAALSKALDVLEAKGLGQLPGVFAGRLTEAEREAERAYLEDVAIGSVDLLIERTSPDARRLLWVVTLASEPVGEGLLAGVWSGRSARQEQLDGLRQLVAMADQLPEEMRQKLDAMPPELRSLLERGEAPTPAAPIAPLLAELTASGLLAAQGEETSRVYAFHELVRERAEAWMEAHPEEQAGRTAEVVWTAYGDRYAAAFQTLQASGAPGSREKATESGRRGLGYLVRARAFERLGALASALVTGTSDPRLLRGVIAELEGVADELPPGQQRWRAQGTLATAFLNAGRPDAGLALYEQATAEAEAAGDWRDVAVTYQNWANALHAVGRLDHARATYLRSAEAERKAGSPRVNVVASELEALRVDVTQGEAEAALPQIETRLDDVRDWWVRHRAGEEVADAPDPVDLGGALISALDIARSANQALKRWQACLELLNETEETKRALGEGELELARTRFNRYFSLLNLGQLGQAQEVLEGCLVVFRRVDDLTNQAKALAALADLWGVRGDIAQAVALQRQALAVRDRLPDLAGRSASHGNLSIYLDRAGRGREVGGASPGSLLLRPSHRPQPIPFDRSRQPNGPPSPDRLQIRPPPRRRPPVPPRVRSPAADARGLRRPPGRPPRGGRRPGGGSAAAGSVGGVGDAWGLVRLT